MFCSKCGQQVPDDARFCPQCQAPLVDGCQCAAGEPIGNVAPTEIKSGMAEAILVTIFCCLPFGIVAVIYASKVSSLAACGDIAGARNAAEQSKKWSWIAFGCGLAANIIFAVGNVLCSL